MPMSTSSVSSVRATRVLRTLTATAMKGVDVSRDLARVHDGIHTTAAGDGAAWHAPESRCAADESRQSDGGRLRPHCGDSMRCE